MPIFGGASRGAVIKVKCPHCGEVQTRARTAPKSTYECRKCRKQFTREEGEAEAAKER